MQCPAECLCLPKQRVQSGWEGHIGLPYTAAQEHLNIWDGAWQPRGIYELPAQAFLMEFHCLDIHQRYVKFGYWSVRLRGLDEGF